MAHAFIVRHTEYKVLTGIAISILPTKTSYTDGDMLDLSGMVVTAMYNSGEIVTITDYTTSPENGSVLSTIGTVTVTVSYMENGVTGTTSFTVSVAEAKPYAKELEYIESTGTQYIDTGVIPQSNSFDVDFKVRSTASTSAENWFVTIGQDKITGKYAQVGTWSSKFCIHLSGVTVNGNTPANNNDVSIKFSVSGSTATLSGDATYSVTTSQFNTNEYRNKSITICDGNWRCYGCKITLNGKLVRNYIPVLDFSGVPCMYDMVEKQFYYNQGTGIFKYPVES